MTKQTKRIVPFQMIISALLDESKTFPPMFLHRFSDIPPKDLDEIKKIWLQINPARRQALLEDLEELAETDNLTSFEDLAKFALRDPEPMARAAAIRLLWEAQDLKLVPIYIEMLDQDSATNVRAAAASALGLFIYLGELDEIPMETLHQVEEALLRAATGPDQPVVRRRSVESLGYSSREEVPPLIENGFSSGDIEWLSSALFAMGRSADPRWENFILQMLNHADPRAQMEAVRAAGQLEMVTARQPLMDLLDEEADLDDDVFMAAIWSLSQIGGQYVRERLEQIQENTADEDIHEFIDTALENLSFTEDFEIFDMLDLSQTDPQELDLLEGLSDEEDTEEDTDEKPA